MNSLTYIVLFLGLLLLGLASVCYLLHQRLTGLVRQIAQVQIQQDGLQQQLLVSQQEIHEVRSGSIGVGDKVKALMRLIKQTEAKQEMLATQDPQSRLYNQAAKLVASGCSIEDVMRECDMPKAEAELVFNLHKQ
ncbi:MAG: hypothetical protein ACI8R9_002126 [Paraglaciecola sp.]|jgi:hypothetical protein